MHVPGYAADDYPYPNNICITDGKYGETPHSGFANTLSALWSARGNGDYVTAHTVVARGSACIWQIGKADSMAGGRTYAAGISETRVYKKLADQAGRTYGVAAVLLTHGECDSQNPAPFNPNYETTLYQLRSDYNADIKAAGVDSLAPFATAFLGGRQRRVFDVSFDGKPIGWVLDGHTVTASSRSRRCGSDDDKDDDDHHDLGDDRDHHDHGEDNEHPPANDHH